MPSFSPPHMHLRRPSESSIKTDDSFLLISPRSSNTILPTFTHRRTSTSSFSLKSRISSDDQAPPPRYVLQGLDSLPPEVMAINIPCYLAEHGLYENLRSRRPFSMFTPKRKKRVSLPTVESSQPADIIDFLRQLPNVNIIPSVMALCDFHQAIQESPFAGMGQITDLRYYDSKHASPGTIRNFVAVCQFPQPRTSVTTSALASSTSKVRSVLYIILRFPIDITELLEQALMVVAGENNITRYRRDVALYLMPPGEEPAELEKDSIRLRRCTTYSGMYLKECVEMMDNVIGRIPKVYLDRGGSQAAAKAVYYAQSVPLLAPFFAPPSCKYQRDGSLPAPPK